MLSSVGVSGRRRPRNASALRESTREALLKKTELKYDTGHDISNPTATMSSKNNQRTTEMNAVDAVLSDFDA